MLHFETIESSTLSLLRQLLSNRQFGEFYLAGGTSLALQLGHRKSFDLDFFGATEKSMSKIATELRTFKNPREVSRSENNIVWMIDGVKVDFVNYWYPLIENPILVDDLRLLSLKDIAAMKLEAIKGRGRKRDFYNIYFLLKQFSLEDLFSFHNKKFEEDSSFFVMKSLSYFHDAEEDPDILTIQKDPGWDNVKKIISEAVINLC